MKNMKPLFLIILVLCISFSTIGCDDKSAIKEQPLSSSAKTESESTEEKDYTVLGVFEELKDTIDCDYLENNVFITKEGNLYKTGNYSDGSKIKRFGEGINFVRIVHLMAGAGCYIVDSNNNIYYFNYESLSISLNNNSSFNKLDNIHKTRLFGVSNIESGIPYISVQDGKVFLEEKDAWNDDVILSNTHIYTFENDEIFERLQGDMIITNKNRYEVKQKTHKSDFDDVPTTYSYYVEKLPDLSDDIVFESEKIKIDKNGTIRYYYK